MTRIIIMILIHVEIIIIPSPGFLFTPVGEMPPLLNISSGVLLYSSHLQVGEAI